VVIALNERVVEHAVTYHRPTTFQFWKWSTFVLLQTASNAACLAPSSRPDRARRARVCRAILAMLFIETIRTIQMAGQWTSLA